MKFKFFLLYFIGFLFNLHAQDESRKDLLLIQAEKEIYNDFQEAHRLLSFVNSSISEGDQQVLSQLVLSDSYYLKGDYVGVVNSLIQADKLLDEKENENEIAYLVRLFWIKYDRILGFPELAHQLFQQIPEKKISNRYNISSLYIDEKAFEKEDKITQLALWKEGLSKVDTTQIFGYSQYFTFQERISEVYLGIPNVDSAHYYVEKLKKSKSSIFHAKGILLLATLNPNSVSESELNTVLNSHLDISTQIGLRKILAEYYLGQNNIELYKENLSKIKEAEQFLNNNQMKARDMLIFYLENQKHSSSSVFQKILMGVILILALLSFAGFLYYKKTKKEYQRFLKIIHQAQNPEKDKVSKITIVPEKTEQIILKKLEKFEQSKKFLHPEVSLTSIAKQLDTNTKYLSDIINRNKGGNFNHYINGLKINYIIEKMKQEPKYLNYKIYFLAQEAGFSSQSSFSSVFKSITGLSPFSFIKFLKNESKNN
jgi:YesN/AraC family two-component response regulator